MAATLSFADCETAYRLMLDSGERASNMYKINQTRACYEAKRMWYFYETAQADCSSDKWYKKQIKQISSTIQSVYNGTCNNGYDK